MLLAYWSVSNERQGPVLGPLPSGPSLPMPVNMCCIIDEINMLSKSCAWARTLSPVAATGLRRAGAP